MNTNLETVRKRNAKKKETATQRHARCECDHIRNQQKRASRSGKVREKHLESEWN